MCIKIENLMKFKNLWPTILSFPSCVMYSIFFNVPANWKLIIQEYYESLVETLVSKEQLKCNFWLNLRLGAAKFFGVINYLRFDLLTGGRILWEPNQVRQLNMHNVSVFYECILLISISLSAYQYLNSSRQRHVKCNFQNLPKNIKIT